MRLVKVSTVGSLSRQPRQEAASDKYLSAHAGQTLDWTAAFDSCEYIVTYSNGIAIVYR